jgi:4-amino-4-deoxy-L-arabinose transferase-like glycosyltransferase
MWRTDGVAFVVLFAVALAFRAVVLWQTARTPYLEVANIDSGSYHEWALEIAGGAWWPRRGFYQSPFYAYFLAILYRLFGDGPWAPRVAQIVLGSVTPVLVYGLGTRLFSRRVGWIGGLLFALYGVAVLEEVTISKTTPLMVTAVGAVAAYLRYGPGAHAGGLAAAGVLMGLTVVGVAQWVLAFLVLAAYLPWLAADAPRPRRVGAVAAFVGGTLLFLAPVAAWNSWHAGGFVLTSGGSGLNLYSGNNERSTGLAASPRGLRDIPEFEEDDSRRLAEQATGRALSSAGVERYWTGQALEWIGAHPGAWLRLLGTKLTVLWNAYEIPDNYHYVFMREHFLTALGAGVTLAVVGPLALVGLLLPMWRRRGTIAFTLAWTAYMVTPLLYYVRGRYRLPLAPFLAVLAGVGVERIVRAVAARRWDHVGLLGGALLAATLAVNHTHCEPAHHGFDRLCFAKDIWYDLEWMKLAGFHQERGDLDRAIAALANAQACSVPRGIGQMTFWRGDLERQKGDALAAAGDRAGAVRHLQTARAQFERCRQIRYRTDATEFHLNAVGQRLAELE